MSIDFLKEEGYNNTKWEILQTCDDGDIIQYRIGANHLMIGVCEEQFEGVFLEKSDVKQLIQHLQSWLDTGSLEVKG